MSKLRPSVARQIIKALGGLSEAADKIGAPISTVQYWGEKGIPAWRVDRIKFIAERDGIAIPDLGAA